MKQTEQASKLVNLLGTLVLEFQEFEYWIDLICKNLVGDNHLVNNVLINGKSISEKIKIILPLFEVKFPDRKYIYIINNFVKECNRVNTERNNYIHSFYFEYGNSINTSKSKRNAKKLINSKVDLSELEKTIHDIIEVKDTAYSYNIDIRCLNEGQKPTFLTTDVKCLAKEELTRS